MTGRRDGGQALIETALILPILVILFVGIFDIGRIILASDTLTAAVREATRYGAVHGQLSGTPSGPGSATYTPPSTDTAINTVVQRYAVGINTPLTISSTWPNGNANRRSRIVVTATTPFVPILSAAFIGGALTVTLRGSSTMVIEQ
jgi:Flp pilus assembly protein TadG